MRKVTDLTDEELVEIYNSNADTNYQQNEIEIVRTSYGSVEINRSNRCDDTQLVISDQGAIYGYNMDSCEISYSVIAAFQMLQLKQIFPFYFSN